MTEELPTFRYVEEYVPSLATVARSVRDSPATNEKIQEFIAESSGRFNLEHEILVHITTSITAKPGTDETDRVYKYRLFQLD